MCKRAVVPGTLISRNSPRVPERAAGVDPSTVTDASGIGSPLLASTIVPPIVCVWARAGAAHVTIVRTRRPIAREPGDERICDIRPPSAEDPDGLPRDVPKQVSPIAIGNAQFCIQLGVQAILRPARLPARARGRRRSARARAPSPRPASRRPGGAADAADAPVVLS